MSEHIIDGEFQSDKYPTCPRGKVPLSTKDPMAQDLLWLYAQRRRAVDPQFSDDLEFALKEKGYTAAGLVVVPKEPTEAMRWAGSKAKNAHVIAGGHRANPSEIYKAMIGKAGK